MVKVTTVQYVQTPWDSSLQTVCTIPLVNLSKLVVKCEADSGKKQTAYTSIYKERGAKG